MNQRRRPAITDAADRRVSAVNCIESAIVIDASRDPIATRHFDDFIREANIFIEPVTEIQKRSLPRFWKGSTPEEIVAKLRQVDVLIFAGPGHR